MSNRTLLVDRLSAALGSTKVDADGILKIFSTVLQDHLAEHRNAVIPGFGRLKVVARPSRVGRNPKTGASITVPAKDVVKFKKFKA
jgi:DNA-binding protein HU-beta